MMMILKNSLTVAVLPSPPASSLSLASLFSKVTAAQHNNPFHLEQCVDHNHYHPPFRDEIKDGQANSRSPQQSH